MKHYLLLGVCLIYSMSALAQKVKIVETDTKQPISDVLIFNKKKDKSISSDKEGMADLSSFSSTESIYFQHIFYQIGVFTKNEIEQNNFIVSLVPNIEGLDEVVISASKFEQHKRDVPQKIVSINAEENELSNPQTSADLLESTGNIFMQKSQLGGGSPMIRGFSTNRLLITVDGVRMNNAIFRGGNLQNVISIDPFTVQNVEVTLSAGSVVYGSDAIGGVMGFYTQKPQLSYADSLFFKANAVTRYSTANEEKTGHIDMNFGLKKWAFLTSVSYTDFDDLRMGSHGPEDYIRPEYVEIIDGVDTIVTNPNPLVQVPTGYDQINFMQKARYESSDDISFDLGLYYTTTSDYSRYDRLIRYRGDNLRSAEWNYGPQRWFMGNLQLTKLSGNSTLYNKIQATVAYQNFQESRMDRDFGDDIRNIREEAVDAISANLDLEKQVGTMAELFYGVEYIYNKVSSTGDEENVITNTSIPTVSRYPDGSSWQSIAAYTSVKYKPNTKFVVQGGLRYNHLLINADFTENNQYLNLPYETTKVSNGAFTGSAGMTWTPNDRLQWRLNGITSFRSPNIDDIGKVFDSEPGSVVVPNDDLKPEYAYGGELGLKLNFDNVVVFNLATYYTYLDNALVRRDYNLNGQTEIEYDGELSNVQAIQNAAFARVYGFEAGITVNFCQSLKLTSQYNTISGKEEDDSGAETPLRHAAPNFGNTHLVWKNAKLKIDAFAEYNNELSFYQLAPSELEKEYIYALDQNGNPYAPSWYTLNIRTQYKFSEAFTFTASLENITDQRYRPYSSGISAAGRNFIISLKYSL
ncbi:MAG: TonB-dependent receptor [Gelidibacter sp.]